MNEVTCPVCNKTSTVQETTMCPYCNKGTLNCERSHITIRGFSSGAPRASRSPFSQNQILVSPAVSPDVSPDGSSHGSLVGINVKKKALPKNKKKKSKPKDNGYEEDLVVR